MIEFLVQMPNLQLSFQIDFVIIFRAQTISRLRAVLAHHDDGRLHRGQTGENQIEKNEWKRIERSGSKQHGIRSDPYDNDNAKGNEEFPTPTELGDTVGESFAKSQFFFELLLDVAGKNLVLFQAFDDFLVERRKFSNLVLQNLFHVILAEFAQVIETDEPFAVQVGQFLFDELEERRPNQLRDHSAVRRLWFFANLANQWCGAHRDFAAELNRFCAVVDSIFNRRISSRVAELRSPIASDQVVLEVSAPQRSENGGVSSREFCSPVVCRFHLERIIESTDQKLASPFPKGRGLR